MPHTSATDSSILGAPPALALRVTPPAVAESVPPYLVYGQGGHAISAARGLD
ncbi:MAG: hypothetical protein ACOYKZ_07065 [Chlamydiia bacterium]